MLTVGAGSTGTASTFFAIVAFGIAWGIWKLLGIDTRWPGEGIIITSRPSDRFVRLQFRQAQYQADFVKLNQTD